MQYFTWPELQIGDRFRIAGYDDLLVKVSATHAKNFGTLKRLYRPITLGKRGEVLEIAPNVGGLILAI